MPEIRLFILNICPIWLFIFCPNSERVLDLNWSSILVLLFSRIIQNNFLSSSQRKNLRIQYLYKTGFVFWFRGLTLKHLLPYFAALYWFLHNRQVLAAFGLLRTKTTFRSDHQDILELVSARNYKNDFVSTRSLPIDASKLGRTSVIGSMSIQ